MLRDTIFSPGFGNRPSCLVGREGVLKGLCEGLQTAPGRKERSTVLLGQRGSGKTVLLWELAERASELGFVVATPTIVSEGMLARIVEKIQDAGSHFVSDVAPRISGGSFGAFGFEVGLEFSRDVQETKSEQFKLTQLARKLSGQGCGILILVDQLQANSVDVRELVSVYQELVGEALDVALVMAGLPGAVSATLNDRVLTFLNRANKVTLGPLASLDVEAFYADAFERLGVRIAPEQISRATEATKGSPYLMQLVGHGLVLRANEGGIVSDEAFDEAIERARLHAHDLAHALGQAPLILAECLDEGHDELGVRREPHAAAPALEQRDAPLALQVSNHAADAGLAVVKLARRPRDAPAAHRLNERAQLLDTRLHRLDPPVPAMRFSHA